MYLVSSERLKAWKTHLISAINVYWRMCSKKGSGHVWAFYQMFFLCFDWKLEKKEFILLNHEIKFVLGSILFCETVVSNVKGPQTSMFLHNNMTFFLYPMILTFLCFIILSFIKKNTWSGVHIGQTNEEQFYPIAPINLCCLLGWISAT